MQNIRSCPKCGVNLYILDTRTISDGDVIWRRRVCPSCKKITYSLEVSTGLSEAKAAKYFKEYKKNVK